MSLFNPENFAIGGAGVPDDVDATIAGARIMMFDYQGTQPESPAIEITFNVDGTDIQQCYTVGKSSEWQPSEDGLQLVAVGRSTQINSGSNGAIFLAKLMDAGFPSDKITDNIDFLVGLQGHIMHVPPPVRKGLKEGATPKPIAVFSTITKYPWETAPAAGAKAAAPATKQKPGPKPGAKAAAAAAAAPPPAPAEGENPLAEKAQGVILEILAEVGEAKKQELPRLIFAKIPSDPDKAAVLQLAFKDDFLKSGPWTFVSGKLSLAG